MGRVRRWIVRLLLRSGLAAIEREVEEEFRFHLDMKTAALEAEGMSPDEARAAAVKCFGDTERFRRLAAQDLSALRTRERRLSHLDWIRQDLRDGVRQMVRRPGFTLLVVGTLALGFSTSTAVFTYVNAYFRPFPGVDARGLDEVYLASEQNAFGALSYPDFQDLSRSWSGHSGVAGVGRTQFAASARHDERTDVVAGEGVTGNFFSVLGVEFALGRGLSPDDDRPGAPAAAVLSYAYWARRYGSDPAVLGETILLNNEPYTIVGVAGRDFLGSTAGYHPEVWLPFEQFMRVYWARSDTRIDRDVGSVWPLVRLGPDISPTQARQELDALATSLDETSPLAEGPRAFILAPATWISPATRVAEASTTRIMMLAAACLLLLACANVANLVLSTGARRHREMALRSAMGASRWRLVRQLISENVILSALAGALAVVVAGPVSARLGSYFARPSVWGADVPRELSVDVRVMAFGLVVAVVTGIATGIVPALRAAGRNAASVINAGGIWSTDGRSGRRSSIFGGKDVLVSAQIALTVVLLFVAGLTMRTLNAAEQVDAGFDVDQTLASYVSTSSMGVPVAERHRFFRQLVERFDELPWVEAATVAENAPLSGHPIRQLRPDQGSDAVVTTIAKVWPGYFSVMSMDILSGRPIEAGDSTAANGVVVVNETLARRISADGHAVGRTLWWPAENDQPDRPFEVVGVVRNARQTSLLAEPEPVAYFSLPQQYSSPGNAFLVKVAGDPAAAVDRIERELRDVDPRIAIVNILPYRQVVRGFLYSRRMNAELFGVIAALGLILAAAGVFGVVTLAVARRRRELGIRVAVGADRPAVVRLVLSTVFPPVMVGLLFGLAGAVVATRYVADLLWGVAPSDPVTMLVGGGVLFAVLGLAVAVPVTRALRMDPVASLRAE